MTIILYVVKDGKTPLYIACYNGHDKVVQVLLDHGVEVDVLDKVSEIHVKICRTKEVNEFTSKSKVTKISMYCHCSAMVVMTVYQCTTKICNQ